MRADFDGDGRRDSAVVSSTGARCDAAQNRWSLTVRLASGRRLQLSLTDDLSRSGFDCLLRCRASAAPDFDKDGKAELEVSVLQGASGHQVAVYAIGGHRIYRLTRSGSRYPFLLDYLVALRHGADVVCRTMPTGARHIVQVRWANAIDAAGRSHVSEDVYLFAPPVFRRVSHSARYKPRSKGYPPPITGTNC